LILGQIARYVALHSVAQKRVPVVGRDNEGYRFGAMLSYPSLHFEGLPIREDQIQQQYVGTQFLDQPFGLSTIASYAHDLNIRSGF